MDELHARIRGKCCQFVTQVTNLPYASAAVVHKQLSTVQRQYVHFAPPVIQLSFCCAASHPFRTYVARRHATRLSWFQGAPLGFYPEDLSAGQFQQNRH